MTARPPTDQLVATLNQELESIIGAYGVKYDSAAIEQVHPVARDLLATIKAAVDPQNLIAPGRYGTPLRHVDRA